MPGALTKLPVELHTTILNYLEADSQDGNIEHDAPISTLFPSNAASVCTLWRDILAKALTPDSWKTVVFDIAYEPALLGAFWWSMALGKIEVMVYNSSSSSASASGSAVEVDKAHEKRRVSAIVSALRPHVQRFRRIDVQTLKLKGIIDDDDDQGEGQASSLCHIITAWSGVHLIIDTCPSFDDALLAWMGSEIGYPTVNLSDPHRNKIYLAFPAQCMVHLTIQDCANFTPFALQLLVKTHNNLQSQGPPIRHLSVLGKVPSPSEEEKRWFRGNSKDMVVNWEVMEGVTHAEQRDCEKNHIIIQNG
ncbi:hypothetical protein GALMADRAFT_281587 [Galerina marginata CBS 339.88]|uniref:F-box domain-containing protein n=1 Tax=Galerina marginata (strain CBS 339.88) TaxID=685588 RepID=A0A067SZC0_GALM3|nr:hypothetical protein GALMADRAFT_281587 [Galerina marginata CBS 339.88]